MRSRNTIKAILKGIASFFVSLFGILGWLLQAMMQLLTATLIIGALAALLIYVKAKPCLLYTSRCV